MLTSLKKYRKIWGLVAIVSRYRKIWGHIMSHPWPAQLEDPTLKSNLPSHATDVCCTQASRLSQVEHERTHNLATTTPLPHLHKDLQCLESSFAPASPRTLQMSSLVGESFWNPNPRRQGNNTNKNMAERRRFPLVFVQQLSGTGDSQRNSRESIRAKHSQLKPYFSSASGRFA